MIGRASQETGAGRMFKGQTLDFNAGIVMKKRTGDMVQQVKHGGGILVSAEKMSECGGFPAKPSQSGCTAD